jgi:hypothetical protein
MKSNEQNEADGDATGDHRNSGIAHPKTVPKSGRIIPQPAAQRKPFCSPGSVTHGLNDE